MEKKSLSYVYLLSYAILLFSDIFRYININKGLTNGVFKLGLIIFLILNLFIFLVRKHYVNYYLSILLIFIIIFIFGFILNFKLIPIELFELIVLLSNVDLLNLNKFINIDLIVKIIMMIVILSLNAVNIIPTISYNKGLSLGFSNSDIAGYIVLSTAFSLLLMFNNEMLTDNKHFMIAVLSIFVIFLFYHITQFRSMLIVGVILLFLICLIKLKKIRHYISDICMALSIGIPILSIVMVYKFNPYSITWHYINKLLSNRLIMQYTILQEYPLKFLGHHISNFVINQGPLASLGYNLSSGVTIDNFYLSIIYYDGIIGLLILMYIIIRILYVAKENNEYIPYILLFSLIICSCVASSMLNAYNFPVILYIIAYQLRINKIRKHMEYLK